MENGRRFAASKPPPQHLEKEKSADAEERINQTG
jgi:hypothetical protein